MAPAEKHADCIAHLSQTMHHLCLARRSPCWGRATGSAMTASTTTVRPRMLGPRVRQHMHTCAWLPVEGQEGSRQHACIS